MKKNAEAANAELIESWLNNLRKAHKATGWSQRRLAIAAQISESTLRFIISGSVHSPSIGNLIAIANGLGMPLINLLYNKSYAEIKGVSADKSIGPLIPVAYSDEDCEGVIYVLEGSKIHKKLADAKKIIDFSRAKD